MVFKSKPFQTWLVGEIAYFLSDELGTKVRVGSVDIEFFKTGILENIYIEDQKGDTLFYFKKLKVDYSRYNKDKRIIQLNYLGIEGGKVLFGEHKNDSIGNYNFIIDYFNGGPRDPNKPKVIWTIYCKSVEIDNMRFDYFNRNDPKPDFMDFDYNDMSFRNIYAEFKDFYLIDDSVHFQTNHLETTEKCGFRVDHLSADTKLHSGGIEFHSLSLITPYSNIGDMFVMKTKNWKSYNNFNEDVYLYAQLNQAEIDTRDLSYFTYNLKDWQTLAKMSGSGEGTLSKLKGKNTELYLYDGTVFKGDWSMTGLPDFKNTILDFDVKLFKSEYNDLNKIALNSIPDNFKSLGTIEYKGMFSGFFNDFITFGTIVTDIGNFKTDINIKFKEGLDLAQYSGTLKTDFFKIKAFIPEAQIDEIAFDANIKGTGLSRETYHIFLDGKIPQLKFQNQTIKDITAQGEISKEYFTGDAIIKDKNIDLEFSGEFRSDIKVPEAHFMAKVNRFNLASFGLDTTIHSIVGDFNLDFTGHNLDNAEGSITGENVIINRNNVSVSIPYINLTSNDYNSVKELRLRSDLVDARIKGLFSFEVLDVSIMHMMHQLIPAYFEKPAMQLPNEDFVFEFDLKRPDDITSLYLPNLTMKPCKGSGFYTSRDQSLKFDFSNSLIQFNEYTITNLDIEASKKPASDLNLNVSASDFTDFSLIKIRNIVFESTAIDNAVDFKLQATDTGYKVGLITKGQLLFVEDSIHLQLNDMRLNMADVKWDIDSNVHSVYTNDKFIVDYFVFSSGAQTISLKGELGSGSKSRLDLKLDSFSLETINYFTSKTSIPKIGGMSDGVLVYSIADKATSFQSDLFIRDFSLSNDTFGNLSVYTHNLPNSNIQHLKVYVDKGSLDSLRIEGNIDYKSKNQNLKLYAILPQTDLSVFEPFLEGVMSGMEGKIYTKDSLKITGSFKDPVVEGELIVKDGRLVVDYLNTAIRFSSRIVSEKDRITLMPFTFYDDRDNYGKAKAYVFHKSFSDFNMNLNIYELNNFHILNTSAADNDLFYGQGYVSGSATLIGPFDNLAIRVNARTRPGTHFFLPISDGDASGLPDYVHFKTLKKKVIKRESDFPIQSLVMDIEATNDADVEIIFDEILGDKIKGSGHGNIKIEMNKSGDFYMFGTYTVDKGEYLFTAFNLYNKKFYVRQGGTITWYGDPLEAKLNLVAYNTENADPAPLLTAVAVNSNLGSTTNTQASQTIKVESELYLRGNLFSPEVSFGLYFPDLNNTGSNNTSALTSVISRIRSDKEEVNRQVFSLLLMRKFLPPSFAQAELGLNTAGSNALSNAGSDLLSSQISNWLNKIDPNWRVNVIYKNGTISLPPEYGVALSSMFFNNKLSFDGSFSNYSTLPNINLEYKVTKKGNVKVKAYTRSSFNIVNTTSLSTPITTNGLGIVYTKEFNIIRWFAWLKKKKNRKSKKSKDAVTQ